MVTETRCSSPAAKHFLGTTFRETRLPVSPPPDFRLSFLFETCRISCSHFIYFYSLSLTDFYKRVSSFLHSIASCRTICYTRHPKSRPAHTSLSDWYNLQIHFSWILNARDASKLRPFFRMRKRSSCVALVICISVNRLEARPDSRKAALTGRRLTE